MVKEFLSYFPPFFWHGLFGNISIEVYSALQYAINNDGHCPPLYKKRFYIVARVAFAGISGCLPSFLGASTIYSAIYIGACAPLIMERRKKNREGKKKKSKPKTKVKNIINRN